MKALFKTIIILFLSSFQANAETGKIIVGTSTGYPPYYYYNEDVLKGAYPEILLQVAEKLGYQIEFRQYPWKRMLFVAKAGEVDAIMPLFKTATREKFLHFHENSLGYEENKLFVLKSSNITSFQSFSSISGRTIGTITDYSYGEAFDKASFLTLKKARNEQHLMKLLTHRRIDLGIGSKPVVLYHAKKLNIDSTQIRFLKPPVTREPLYIGFSIKGKTEKLSQEFSRELNQLKKQKNIGIF